MRRNRIPSGGVSAQPPDRAAIDAYLQAIDIPAALQGLKEHAAAAGGLRGRYLDGLALCFETMWDLAMEMLGKGDPVPYARCVMASTGRPPEPSQPAGKRERVAQLLAESGYPAVDEWRAAHRIPMASVKPLGAAVIAWFDQMTAANVVPYFPAAMHGVPDERAVAIAGTGRRAGCSSAWWV